MSSPDKQPKQNNDSLRTRIKIGFVSILAATGITGLIIVGNEVVRQGNRSYFVSGGYCAVSEHGYNPEGSKVIWAGKERNITSVHRTLFNGYNSVICEFNDGAGVLLDVAGKGIEFVNIGGEAVHKETGTKLFAIEAEKPKFLLDSVSDDISKSLYSKYSMSLISAGDLMRLTPDSIYWRDLGLTFTSVLSLVLLVSTARLIYVVSDTKADLENAKNQVQSVNSEVVKGSRFRDDNVRLKQSEEFWRNRAHKAEAELKELKNRPVPVQIITRAMSNSRKR